MISVENWSIKTHDLIIKYLNDDIDSRELLTMHHNLFYDIEEMHKKEIIRAYKKGEDNIDNDKSAEQYYNDEFTKY